MNFSLFALFIASVLAQGLKDKVDIKHCPPCETKCRQPGDYWGGMFPDLCDVEALAKRECPPLNCHITSSTTMTSTITSSTTVPSRKCRKN